MHRGRNSYFRKSHDSSFSPESLNINLTSIGKDSGMAQYKYYIVIPVFRCSLLVLLLFSIHQVFNSWGNDCYRKFQRYLLAWFVMHLDFIDIIMVLLKPFFQNVGVSESPFIHSFIQEAHFEYLLDVQCSVSWERMFLLHYSAHHRREKN